VFGFIRNRCTTSSEMAVRHTPKWLFVFARDTHNTPNGNRVTLEREARVEGPAPHVFVYDKAGNRYRVQVPGGKTAQQVAEDLVSGKEK
jgi:hypothetical protein